MVISEIRWSSAAYAVMLAGVMVHFTIMAVVTGGGNGPPQVWLALMGAYALAFTMIRLFQVLRVRVDGMDLKVGFGPFSKRIPLHDIDRFMPVQYRWLQW